jgi:hypothetical protein
MKIKKMETETELKVKTKHYIIKYPNGGTYIVKYKCDICHESNYPIVMWPTDDDSFIHTVVCKGCIDKISETLTKSFDSMGGDTESLAESGLTEIVAEEEKS